MDTNEDQVVAGPNVVVIRSHTRATHTGEFLGIPATGRHIEWDAITMVQVRDDKVVGQWAQPDLFAIYRQISDHEVLGAALITAPLEGAPSWAHSAS